LAWARSRLHDGAPGDAAAVVNQVLARPGMKLNVRVDAWLLTATCELEMGRKERARTALDRALRLAEKEGLRRPVMEAPPELRRFLRLERDIVDQHTWLNATAASVPNGRPRNGRPHAVHRARSPGNRPAPDETPALVVEALTAKETEVLRYLAALFSTEEIAGTMFVSVNTVKTHIRGVLRKLAASRRNEAVRRARELGLV
ncbi:MAG TPA: LuxR C-terminal-related transcriptional regulator, partial [Pilimelia sp.]|nr:LuxR C-terminal-related transcriptional regulator [Pilimelia sp.]